MLPSDGLNTASLLESPGDLRDCADEVAVHDGDHRPTDVGLVMAGEALVVADCATAAGHGGTDCARPPKRQHLERVHVIAMLDHLQGQAGRRWRR